MKRLVGGWLIASVVVWALLPDPLSRMLQRNKIDPSMVSILIQETRTGREVASHLPRRARVPASVIKIYTAYSALLGLGSSFRWPTKLYYTGRFSHGVIQGDLAVEAFGDPTMTTRDLEKIARRLRRLGIRHIKGNMILDRSFFAVNNSVTSGFDRNRYSEYNAMPDTLMLNDHMSSFVIQARHNTIVAAKTIPHDGYDLINRMQPTKAACKGKHAWPRIAIGNRNGRSTVTLSGTISTRCPKRRITRLLTHTYESFYYAFKSALNSAGIVFDGRMILARVPRSARALMIYRSPPLWSIVAKTLKKSNNLYARHLLLLLGAQHYGAPGTETKGVRAIASILSDRRVWDPATRIINGSGLSRKARTSAHALVRVLQDAHRHYGHQWLNALSIAGKDGTIRKRFKHSIAKGRAWMKTGTLNRAKNIAGYVRGKSGRLYTVAILYNGAERWKGSALQNQIIEWLARR